MKVLTTMFILQFVLGISFFAWSFVNRRKFYHQGALYGDLLLVREVKPRKMYLTIMLAYWMLLAQEAFCSFFWLWLYKEFDLVLMATLDHMLYVLTFFQLVLMLGCIVAAWKLTKRKRVYIQYKILLWGFAFFYFPLKIYHIWNL